MDKKFNLENYEEVKDRLVRFYKEYPEGRVETDIVAQDTIDKIVIRATIYRNQEEQDKHLPLATGLAYEVQNDKDFVNNTSHVENCETSAIGRAIANSRLGTINANRPSKEEMQKVEKYVNKPKSANLNTNKTTTEEIF